MQRPGRLLDDRTRFDWLRLLRTDGIGPRSFFRLIDRFGGAAAALEALPELAARSGRAIALAAPDAIRRELDAAALLGVRFVARGEADYPEALQVIDSPPPLLAVRGNASTLKRPALAIVGSRNASAGGLRIAAALARGLGEHDYVIVSGLARGIDAAAHEASLGHGAVAVLAGGHDRIYPREHAKLLAAIVERGAAVSEMPLGWTPRGRDFPRRNRIISGMALGVVVVEAALRSGSLITARFAAEQGREVFAVPGSPLDPRAAGANRLLRDGATLCCGVEDVAEALAPLAGKPPRHDNLRDDPEQTDEPLWDELDGALWDTAAPVARVSGSSDRGSAAVHAPTPDAGPASEALPPGAMRPVGAGGEADGGDGYGGWGSLLRNATAGQAGGAADQSNLARPSGQACAGEAADDRPDSDASFDARFFGEAAPAPLNACAGAGEAPARGAANGPANGPASGPASGPAHRAAASEADRSGAAARDVIAGLLGAAPVAIDDLVVLSGLSAPLVSVALLELDLQGRLQRHGAQAVSSMPG